MEGSYISIIIPVYKVEQYLSRCVESVLRQTYTNLEIILIDDGSPDNCPRICDEYASKDKRIQVIHQPNAGVSNARNNGLKAASGEYVLFIDSDDYIAPAMCTEMLALAQQKQADIVVCNITYTYPKKPSFTPVPFCSAPFSAVNAEQALLLALTEHSFGDTGVWNKLFKRELLSAFYFKENVRSEDFLALCVLLPRAKKIVYTPKSFYYYFQNPNGVTAGRNLLPRLDAYNAVKFCIETCQKYHYQYALAAIQYRYFDAALIAAFLIAVYDTTNKYQKMFEEVLEVIKKNSPRACKPALPIVKRTLWKMFAIRPYTLVRLLRWAPIRTLLLKYFRISER